MIVTLTEKDFEDIEFQVLLLKTDSLNYMRKNTLAGQTSLLLIYNNNKNIWDWDYSVTSAPKSKNVFLVFRIKRLKDKIAFKVEHILSNALTPGQKDELITRVNKILKGE